MIQLLWLKSFVKKRWILFSNTVNTLGIPKLDQSDPVSDNFNDDTLKAILKYVKDPSILTISNLWFLFSDATL